VGKSQEAIERGEEAQKILSNSTFHPAYLRLEVLTDVARLYEDKQLSRAIDAYQQALVVEKELGYESTRTMSNTLGTLAWLLTRAGRPFEAQQHQRRGMDILGEDSLGGWALQSYAETLRELGRVDEAAKYGEEAVSRAKRLNNTISLIQALTTLGRIRRDQKQFDTAKARL